MKTTFCSAENDTSEKHCLVALITLFKVCEIYRSKNKDQKKKRRKKEKEKIQRASLDVYLVFAAYLLLSVLVFYFRT